MFEYDPNKSEIKLGIAKLNDKHWSAIFTLRGKNIRLISVRRSRKKEIELYATNQ